MLLDLSYLSYPLPPDIQRLYEAGDFARMDRVIRLRLDDPRVPEALKAHLRVQTELAYEILRAYPYTQAQMLEILQSHVKDFEEEELETLRDDGTLDWRYVNGEVRFKDNALSGLLKTRAEYAARATDPEVKSGTVNLSHIPVVLLTAQTSVEYTIEGYMYEADDYITKPFNVKLLVSRCNNLVKSRRKLIEKFRNQQPATVTDIAVNQADRELIKKATEIISNNFENPEFNMNVLAAELGLGRNKLYTRMKEITGLTPNEFTLKMKLDESMRLLKNNPELNISEISDRLGFSTTQYFSKCFKSVFGMAPLTFRKSNPAAPDTSV